PHLAPPLFSTLSLPAALPISGVRGGRVRLASFPSAGSAIVPQAIATFRSRHPAVELSMIEAEPDESLPRLRAGELEVARPQPRQDRKSTRLNSSHRTISYAVF